MRSQKTEGENRYEKAFALARKYNKLETLQAEASEFGNENPTACPHCLNVKVDFDLAVPPTTPEEDRVDRWLGYMFAVKCPDCGEKEVVEARFLYPEGKPL